MRNKHFYPQNWPEIALQCKERAGWQCERCHIHQDAERISRRGKPYRVVLMACHKDHTQRKNPDAELLCLCCVCHWWFDFEMHQLEEWRALEHLKHQRLITPERIAAMRIKVFLKAQKRLQAMTALDVQVERERVACYG
jgi:hypothetical protein